MISIPEEPTTPVCKPATTLHTGTCSNVNASCHEDGDPEVDVYGEEDGPYTIDPFTYNNKAARLLTLQEVKNACMDTVDLWNGHSLANRCSFLTENVPYYTTYSGIEGYWLETQLSIYLASAWITGHNSVTYVGLGANGIGVRPVIEVLESDISN